LRFRHDPLFAASLHRLARRVVPAATARQRMSRAAHWLLGQGELPSAADLAFRAGDTPLIAEVSEALGRHLADRSDLETLATWLDRTPEAVFETSLSLPYWRIMTRLGLRRTGGVGELIEAAEPRWRASGDPLHAGRASLCRGMLAFYLGDSNEADQQLRGALEQLPGDAFVERLYAATFLGKLALRQNRDDVAETVLDEAISYAGHLPLDEQWSWRVTAADRANDYALKGDLFSAITKYRFMVAELPAYLQHLEGFLRCRLVNLAIERDDLETANQEFEAVVRLMEGEHRVWHHDAAIAKVRLLVASGQRDEAERWGSSYVKKLRRLPEKEQMVHQLAQIWLERGDLAMVRSWLADMGTPAYPWVNEFGDINPRALAIDLDLAQGDYLRAAVTAQSLADEAAATNRWSEYIGFAVRSAIAQHELGNESGGIEILRPAIRRGAKGGFVRAFDVRGFNIVAMFKDLWGENREVLEVKGNLRRMQHSDLDDPSGSLTRRELEVIRLVSHGMSNQQIADSMYISVNTVRNHLVRICRRLDASSRSEAVAHARQFGILD
jgi:LuxR family maltose regulon positive regulatory protein